MAFHSVQHSSSSYRVGFETKFILELADVSNEFLFPFEVRKIGTPLYERDDSKYHSRFFQKDELLAKGKQDCHIFTVRCCFN